MKNHPNEPISSRKALPDEARSALSRNGEALFAMLDSERLGALPDETHPTDLPLTKDAREALHLGGQSIFDRLDEERVSLIRRKRWRLWGFVSTAAAAALFLIAVPIGLSLLPTNKPAAPGIAMTEKPSSTPANPHSVPPLDPLMVAEVTESTNTAVPEPSSAMLMMISGLLLGLRRRRPR
ncbi:MAG: PEP-CTERM sorting domain-containing protein [Verrucomicrobiota bacterium]